MSTVDTNRVILTGENSVIRLSDNDSDSFTTNATFWRILSSPGGPGHVLYLKSELTEARWRIYADNIAMARWLQSTVLGVIYAELLDLTIAVTDAQFSKSGDAHDFWTERLATRDEEVTLTWYQMGEPFLVHTQPNAIPGRPYGMCTVLVPALGRRSRHARCGYRHQRRIVPARHPRLGAVCRSDRLLWRSRDDRHTGAHSRLCRRDGGLNSSKHGGPAA